MGDDIEDDQREDGDRQRRTLAALRADIEATSILIWRPEDLERAIFELEGSVADEYIGPADEAPVTHNVADLSSEDRNRLKTLKRIANGRLAPRRRLILGSPRMALRVAAVANEAPHFAAFVDLVARAVHLSMTTRTPLRLPPVLLLGEPGIGKSFVIKRIAEAISGDFDLFPMNMLDSFRIRGLNTAWRGAKQGRVAEALLKSVTASPVILLDEFEKAPAINAIDRPYDIWHSLLEQDNASAFVDDFLEFPLRADHVIWIASANSITGLPDSIIDRLLILEIPPPSADQLRLIVDGIYDAVRDRYGDVLDERLGEDVRRALARHNPRRLKRVLDLAVAYAAAAGRDGLLIDDIDRAVALASDRTGRSSFAHPVGFAAA